MLGVINGGSSGGLYEGKSGETTPKRAVKYEASLRNPKMLKKV